MIALGEVVVIGGGCYGGFYLDQLVRAREAGTASWRRLMVVDRDAGCAAAERAMQAVDTSLEVREWDDFLDGWLDQRQRDAGDRIVPSPLMPHLMAEWLLRRARDRWPAQPVTMVPADAAAGTPFDQLHPGDGVRYLSHADWTCPVHCIEPVTCPVIRGPRTWEMGETVRAWTAEHGRRRPTAGPALFTCRHVTHGVGMFGVLAAFEALESLALMVDAEGSADLVVASVSGCHGAMAVLRVGAA